MHLWQMSGSDWQTVLLSVGAYLVGSILTAHLVGRLAVGGDIRRYGPGNVGGANLWHIGLRWALVPVGLFDIAKAALPTWLALGPLDLGYGAAVMVGLCAVIGHAWSIFLGFTGGRALSTMLGTLLVVFPISVLIQSLIMGLGMVLRAQLLTTLGLLALPFLSMAFGRPPAVTWDGITVIPILLTYEGKTYRDGIDVQPAELYAWLRANKHVPGTSSPSVGDFFRVFAGLSRQGIEGIVAIVPRLSLSGTYNSALAAAQLIADVPVRVFHAGTVAMGQGFAALEAARAVAAGLNLDGVAARATEIAGKVQLLAAIDTLEYLYRGGRIGGASALVGTGLQIKPVLCVTNGRVEVFAKVRSRSAAVQQMLRQMAVKARCRPVHVAVLHSNVPDDAEDFCRIVSRRFECAELFTTQLTPIMGAHTGPGVLGVVYYVE